MVYHGLKAYYDCGYFSSFATGAVYDTTVAYASDALSTYVGPLWMQAQTGPEPASLFQAINYTEFQEYEANTANEGYSKNLKIPSDLAEVDPAWATCTPGMYGSWDPPRVLTAARNIAAPTPVQPHLDPSATAAPAAGIAATHFPAAPTPTPTSKQGQDSDPANQQDDSQNIQPNQSSSPGASNTSPVAGGNVGDKNGAEAPNLNINPQNSPDSPKKSLGTTKSPGSIVLASPTPLIVDGNTIEKAPNGGAVIGKTTYTAGYEGQISSVPISVGVDNILIGTTTHALPTATPLLIGGQSMVNAVNGGVIIGTSTYTVGSQAQVFDKALSVGVGSVVVDGTSYAIPTPSTADTVFIDSQSISRAPDGGAIFEGGTIPLGSQSSINGHTISVEASTIVVDGTSYALPGSAGATLQPLYPQATAPVTLSNGAVLTPGGNAAIVSGTTYAIPSDDSVLVANGQTVRLPTETALQSVFTVAGQVFTAAATGFTIGGGQSVALDGTAATLDGTVVSLGPLGVQIGSKTMPLTSAQTSVGSLGGLIMSGFGSCGESGGTVGVGNGSSVLAFPGESSKVGRRLDMVLFGIMGGLVMVWGNFVG